MEGKLSSVIVFSWKLLFSSKVIYAVFYREDYLIGEENVLFPYSPVVVYFTDLSLYSIFWNIVAANKNYIFLPMANLLIQSLDFFRMGILGRNIWR